MTLTLPIALQGDSNVPANELTLRIYPDIPLHFTAEQLSEWEIIHDEITAALANNRQVHFDMQLEQEFTFPQDAYVRYGDDLPDKCRYSCILCTILVQH